MSVKGRVFNITRSSLHDGPGVRTVVYMKGCNMRCRWCHNPEGFAIEPQVLLYDMRCIGCGRCIEICPEHHVLEDGAHRHIAAGCTLCGRCIAACPSTALEICGQYYDSDALMAVLRKDAPYYRRSGGGVTFSGGECLLQADFVIDMCGRCHAEGIHVLIESALNLPWDVVERAAGAADAFYVDVKHMDDAEHRRWTGAGNARILDNLQRLCALHGDVTARVPLIPGVNDSDANLLATCRHAAQLGGGMKGVQLLRYNPMAGDKYDRAGLSYTSFGDEPQSYDYMDALCARLNDELGMPGFVFYKK